MAYIKISELPDAPSLSEEDLVAIVHDKKTYKVTLGELLSWVKTNLKAD